MSRGWTGAALTGSLCEDSWVESDIDTPSARRRYRGGEALIDGELVRADLVVDGGLITGVEIDPVPGGLGDGDVDCEGLVIAPGFIDLQCNGAGGVDITTEPDRIVDVAAELPRFGVTSFLPTVVTARASTRAAAIDAMSELRTADGKASADVSSPRRSDSTSKGR